MTDNALFDDVMAAVWKLRTAFIKHGLKPPISIELGDVRDADIFRAYMPRDMVLSQPRMGVEKDNPEWVCDIMSVEVRMPAQWRMDHKGRRVLNDPKFYRFPREL